MNDFGPILINLSGEYANLANLSGEKGSITGDLRLFELDSFLYVLRTSVSEYDTDILGNFFSKVKQHLEESTPAKEIELEIDSILVPKDNKLTYTFKLRIS